jgi:nucleoside-diphosphate-sugar epimerase
MGQRLVITGASGLIGGILRAGLGDGYAIRGIDREGGDGVDAAVDMTDAAAVRDAFAGAELIVDLAANPDQHGSWDSIRDNNIPATLNALEAAHEAGVRRVVFASSNHVTGMYEHDEPYASVVAGRYDGLEPGGFERITVSHPIRPDGPYGIGKALGEAAGRFYSDAHGLSVICLRIGTVSRQDRPRNVRELATLLTHRDLVHLVDRSLAAPESSGFATVYGVSANTWRIWDIEDARQLLGYEPADDAEAWR